MKRKQSKIQFFVFLLLMLFAFLILMQFNQKETYDIRSRASVEDDAKYCVNPPDCCARMDQSRDAHECEWPIRGYCMNCGSIEGKNEKCGWYWIWHDANDNEYKLGTNGPDGYGCMIGDSPGTMRPKYNSDGSINTLKPTTAPTTAPAPTTKPQPTVAPAVPTEPPIIPEQQTSKTKVINEDAFPTEPIEPKVINVFESPTPSPIPFRLNFKLPNVQLNLVKINRAAKKPLGLFEYLFRTIASYDKLLETKINGEIKKIIK